MPNTIPSDSNYSAIELKKLAEENDIKISDIAEITGKSKFSLYSFFKKTRVTPRAYNHYLKAINTLIEEKNRDTEGEKINPPKQHGSIDIFEDMYVKIKIYENKLWELGINPHELVDSKKNNI